MRLAASTRATLWPSVAASLLVFVALAAAPLMGRYYFGSDLTLLDLSLICAIQRHLIADQPFGISPFLGNGQPIWNEVTAQLLYPLRWPFLAFPPDAAASLQAALEVAIGAGGATWLARTFRVRPFAAACAGVAYALSGTALNLMQHGFYLAAVPWIPIAWAGARRALAPGGSGAQLFASSAALGLVLLGGEPQAFCGTAAVIVLEGLLHLGRRRGSNLRRLRAAAADLFRVSSAIGAGFLIGLLLWAGALAELTLTPRSGALSIDESMASSLEPSNWIGLLLPSSAQMVAPGRQRCSRCGRVPILGTTRPTSECS
jgi:hypothetical protein